MEVLISAELLLHKSYSFVARTLCHDSHKSPWRRSLPNTCEVGWFILTAEWIFQVCCSRHVFKVTRREHDCLAEKQMLSSASSPSSSSATCPHTSSELQEKIPPEPLQKMSLTPVCSSLVRRGLAGACNSFTGKAGHDVFSWRVPLVLGEHQGQGQQLQRDVLQGLVVLKAEICLATNPTR